MLQLRKLEFNAFRIGTDTVFEEIKSKFPKIKIFKLDRESVKTNKEAEKS